MGEMPLRYRMLVATTLLTVSFWIGIAAAVRL